MSIQAMSWVLASSAAELADRLVLLAIANHADAAGENAYPRVDLIAEEARVSRRTVYRCLDNLATLGELEIDRSRGRGRTNGYRLPMEKVPNCHPEKVTSVHEKVTSTTVKGDSCGTHNRQEPSEPFARTCAREDGPEDGTDWPSGKPLSESERHEGLEKIKALRERATG